MSQGIAEPDGNLLDEYNQDDVTAEKVVQFANQSRIEIINQVYNYDEREEKVRLMSGVQSLEELNRLE